MASACYKKRSGDPWSAPCGSAGTTQQGIQVHNHKSQSVSITLIAVEKLHEYPRLDERPPINNNQPYASVELSGEPT